ncbi:MAG: acetyltransferase [Gammaproteobacteria bacterium]|nr:acetyltransferase [Gammaproteobacteria bacterium]
MSLNRSNVKRVPVIIIGAGGHAKVLIEMLKRNEVPIIGIIDLAKSVGDQFMGIKILGKDNVVSKYSIDEVLLVNGVGALPEKTSRWALADHFRSLGYHFSTVVDSTATMASDVQLAEGVQVMAGVVIQPGTKIDEDTIINTRVTIDHDCVIGRQCHIAPGVTLSGEVHVRNGAHIGTGACVIQGVSIGCGSVVGAGSVVLKDVEDRVTMFQVRNEITRSRNGKEMKDA